MPSWTWSGELQVLRQTEQLRCLSSKQAKQMRVVHVLDELYFLNRRRGQIVI